MVQTKFMDLGIMGYREVWKMQNDWMEEARAEKIAGRSSANRLIFVEHPPVYTLGRSGNEANMLVGPAQLAASHAELIKVDRGGDITFHGFGQLVAYPILDLEVLHLGVKEYVNRLEEIVIRTLADYGIDGGRLSGATGVWLDPGHKEARKVCAIGVKCSRHITMHGFALNVNTDLNYFNCIHPCGFVDKGVTSMEREMGQRVDMDGVKSKVLYYFQELLGLLCDG